MQSIYPFGYLAQIVSLLVMLTIGKVASDAGFWFAACGLAIGGVIGTIALMRDAQRDAKRQASK